MNKTWSVIATAAIAVLSSGCGDKKDSVVKPQITWILSGQPVEKPDMLGKELVDWFVPFKDDKLCPKVRFFPQVEAIRFDGAEEVRQQLVNIDPRELVSENQNFVQKLFGSKPKFDKLVEISAVKISGTTIPEKLAPSFVSSPDSLARLINALSKPAGLIAYRDTDKQFGDNLVNAMKTATPDSQKVFVNIGIKPEAFRAAIAKAFCESATNKKSNSVVYFVNGPGFALKTLPLPLGVRPVEKKLAPPIADKPHQVHEVAKVERNAPKAAEVVARRAFKSDESEDPGPKMNPSNMRTLESQRHN